MPKLFAPSDVALRKRVYRAMGAIAHKAFGSDLFDLHNAVKALHDPPAEEEARETSLSRCVVHNMARVEVAPSWLSDHNGNLRLVEFFTITAPSWGASGYVRMEHTETPRTGPWVCTDVWVLNWHGSSAADVMNELDALAAATLAFGEC